MNDNDESPKQSAKRRTRGVFERPAGSDIWWVCYFDENGRKHREKVGPKKLALKVYQKRKNEIQERRFFPERIRRRDVLLKDMIDDYIEPQQGQAALVRPLRALRRAVEGRFHRKDAARDRAR